MKYLALLLLLFASQAENCGDSPSMETDITGRVVATYEIPHTFVAQGELSGYHVIVQSGNKRFNVAGEGVNTLVKGDSVALTIKTAKACPACPNTSWYVEDAAFVRVLK